MDQLMQNMPELVLDQTFTILNELVPMWINGQAARGRLNRYRWLGEEHRTYDNVW